jgi:PPOX class probable F420-dependent enzyme
MRLTDEDARARLAAHDHGVLATRHAGRGVDAVPVVYAVDGAGYLGVPVDRVKPKSTTALQRVRNLEADPRATLLVEHWDATDWSRLWWVRVGLHWEGDDVAEQEDTLASRLAERYPPYRDRPFDRVLVFRIVEVTGWAAVSGAPAPR